mgnify:CR=1 FL=1
MLTKSGPLVNHATSDRSRLGLRAARVTQSNAPDSGLQGVDLGRLTNPPPGAASLPPGTRRSPFNHRTERAPGLPAGGARSRGTACQTRGSFQHSPRSPPCVLPGFAQYQRICYGGLIQRHPSRTRPSRRSLSHGVLRTHSPKKQVVASGWIPNCSVRSQRSTLPDIRYGC